MPDVSWMADVSGYFAGLNEVDLLPSVMMYDGMMLTLCRSR